MNETKFKVQMHCSSCAVKIDNKLAKKGFKAVSNPVLQTTRVENAKGKENEVKKIIKGFGYEVE